jgi:hypothetical protein
MNAEGVDITQPPRAQDTDIVHAKIALRRAAQLARRRAWQAGECMTCLLQTSQEVFHEHVSTQGFHRRYGQTVQNH